MRANSNKLQHQIAIGIILIGLASAANAAAPNTKKVEPAPTVALKKFTTTRAAINEYGEQVRKKLKPLFSAVNVEYPPSQLTWICLKQEKHFYVYAKDRSGASRLVLSYPIIGASGVAGPKLKEGDKQVPEGFYKLDGFRPNVIAHLALSVNYPNDEDRKHASEEGRKNLGGDILIHGSRWSTGCLAMGNPPIEELFVLAHDSGLKSIDVIFAPCDLTKKQADIEMKKQPSWLAPLYTRLQTSLSSFFKAP